MRLTAYVRTVNAYNDLLDTVEHATSVPRYVRTVRYVAMVVKSATQRVNEAGGNATFDSSVTYGRALPKFVWHGQQAVSTTHCMHCGS